MKPGEKGWGAEDQATLGVSKSAPFDAFNMVEDKKEKEKQNFSGYSSFLSRV